MPAAPSRLAEHAEARPSRAHWRRRDVARFALGIVLVAVLAAGFAVAFRSALGFVFARVAHAPNVVQAIARAPLWLRFLCPALGALLAGVIGRFVARFPASHGVSDVMEAVVLGRVHLSMRITLLKSLASWLAIVSGGSLGREGPLIQFGGAVGKLVSDRLKLPADAARLLIAAGTAAGFAAAYNTPVAAVLFVIEVVTGLVLVEAVVPALVATAIATTLTRSVVGAGPIYGQRAFNLDSLLELLSFAGLAVVTALGAQAFMRLVSRGERLFGHLRLPWRTALGGAIAGLLAALLPEVAGNGYEPLNALLDARFPVGFVTLLLVGKCLATTASVSSGSPGGVFTPTLLLGGAVGFLYAAALTGFGARIGAHGGYALVGMAAATAATTHAPLMAAVMVFELSGDYAIVLPLVLVTGIATVVSRALRPDSIYAAELSRRGIRWQLTLEGRRLLD